MLRAPAATTLHVTNGESTAQTLRDTGLDGSVLAWDDVLYEGPVPHVSASELRDLRAGFLAEAGWSAAADIATDLERRDEALADALRAGHVVLWFEHDLYDQLQLLQILSQAGETSGRLELINVDSAEGHERFWGLGELDAFELEALWPLRRPVTKTTIDSARRAWDAFREPDPTALVPFAHRDDPELPFLSAALSRLLEELPAIGNGLSRSERHLLEALDEPRRPHELFLAGQAREEAPFEGDAWAWRRLATLGTGESRLLAPVGGGPTPAPPPRSDGRAFAATAFELTDDGRAVLEGRADRVDLLGLDRWLGGTHLTRENDWRWDGAAVRRR